MTGKDENTARHAGFKHTHGLQFSDLCARCSDTSARMCLSFPGGEGIKGGFGLVWFLEEESPEVSSTTCGRVE